MPVAGKPEVADVAETVSAAQVCGQTLTLGWGTAVRRGTIQGSRNEHWFIGTLPEIDG